MYKVLVIDENPNDFKILEKEISWKLLDVCTLKFAENYNDIRTDIIDFAPDVIICDIGPAFHQLIKLKEAEIPDLTNIVFWGNPPEDLNLLNAIKNIYCDFTPKPLDSVRMTQLLKKALTAHFHEVEKERNLVIFENEVTRLMPSIRENVLRDLLFSGPRFRKYHSNFELELESVGLKPDSLYSVVVSQIAEDIDITEEKTLLRSHLSALKLTYYLDDKAKSKKMRIFPTIMDYRTVAVLVCFNNQLTVNSAQNMIIEFFQAIMDDTKENLGASISVAISRISDDISQSHEMLLDASRALEFIDSGDFKSIILADDIKNTMPITEYNMQTIKYEIEELLDSKNAENVQIFVDKYFCPNYLVSENTYRNIAFTVISVTQIILYERNESFASIFDDEIVLWKKILNFESIQDIKNLMKNILTTAMNHLTTQQNKHHHKIVFDIKNIIETEYAAIENVSEITEKLYLSKNHANYIFKNHTGKNIFDYLIRTRMKKAKEFLLDERYKIYEVAQMVGYKNNAYFTAVFKAYVNMTPNEYRKTQRAGKNI